MKMRKQILIILLLFYNLGAFCQNLVPNSDFESNIGWILDQQNYASFICSPGSYITGKEIFNPQYDPNASTYSYNETQLSVNTPDNYYGYQIPFSGSNYGCIISQRISSNGPDGSIHNSQGVTLSDNTDGYIGILLNQELRKGIAYEIRAKISVIDNATKDTHLKVILCKSINNYGKPSDEEFKHKEIYSNSSEWATFKCYYKPDVDGIKYIFFKASLPFLGTNNHTQITGVFIDDVVVMEKCAFDGAACYAINGPIVPHLHNTLCDVNNPFHIDNLSNVNAANMTILDDQERLVWSKSVQSCNGITNPIFWNGASNSGGSGAAAASYIVKFVAFNKCNHYPPDPSHSIYIIKIDNLTASVTDFSYDPSCDEPIIPGCEPYIYVDKMFNSGENYSYVAANTIRTSNDVVVNNDATLELIAPNHIILTPGFKALPGSNFHAKIDDSFVYKLANNNDNNSSNTSTEETFYREPVFKVFPNPADNILFVNFTLFEKNSVTIKIFNVFGQEVVTLKNENNAFGEYELSYDISSFASGVYLCVIETKAEKYCSKFIKN